MCTKVNATDFVTIHHELGHIYYDLMYNPLAPIFQGAAHDGFHEAIGDTIVLAMTPNWWRQRRRHATRPVSEKSAADPVVAAANLPVVPDVPLSTSPRDGI